MTMALPPFFKGIKDLHWSYFLKSFVIYLFIYVVEQHSYVRFVVRWSFCDKKHCINTSYLKSYHVTCTSSSVFTVSTNGGPILKLLFKNYTRCNSRYVTTSNNQIKSPISNLRDYGLISILNLGADHLTFEKGDGWFWKKNILHGVKGRKNFMHTQKIIKIFVFYEINSCRMIKD